MELLPATPLALLADASAAADAMRSYLAPLLRLLIGLASVAVVFFLVYGGIRYIVSSGNPEKLEEAKKILKNALIGLVVVIAAGTLTAILSHAYNGSAGTPGGGMPALTEIQPEEASGGITDLLVNAITGVLKSVIQTIGKPFIDALGYFTEATPLMADNSSVFGLWLVMIGIVNVLFILVVVLLGFQVMSASTFGFDELDIKHMLPQLGLIFLLINSSIFIIDAVIGLSNGMIKALHAGFPDTTVWSSLLSVVDEAGGFGLGALLIMIVFIILAVMLVVYYVLRIVILYIGAVLAPLLFLLWLLPAFKDFAVTAMKVYVMTIFVLFVHVVILMLAASIFTGMDAAPGDLVSPIMAMVVGVATMLALLKTQAVMAQMSYVSLGPRTARKLGGQVANLVRHYAGGRGRTGGGNKHGNSGSGRGRRAEGFHPSGDRRRPPAHVPVTRIPANKAKPARPKQPTGTTRVAPQAKSEGTPSSSRPEAPKPTRTRVTPSIRKESKQ